MQTAHRTVTTNHVSGIQATLYNFLRFKSGKKGYVTYDQLRRLKGDQDFSRIMGPIVTLQRMVDPGIVIDTVNQRVYTSQPMMTKKLKPLDLSNYKLSPASMTVARFFDDKATSHLDNVANAVNKGSFPTLGIVANLSKMGILRYDSKTGMVSRA